MSEQNQGQEQQPVVEKKKWHEEGNGFGFEVGDVVLLDKSIPIIGHRFCEVLGPSDKRDHCKAKLQNQKSGELQGTVIVLDNKLCTLVAKNGIGNDVLESVKDLCVMEASGIYKTHDQIKSEEEKNAKKKKNETTEEGSEEVAS